MRETREFLVPAKFQGTYQRSMGDAAPADIYFGFLKTEIHWPMLNRRDLTPGQRVKVTIEVVE